MQALRQVGGGLIIAAVSLLLVIGGISLSLAETADTPHPPTPTPLSPIGPLELFAPTVTAVSAIEVPTFTAIPTLTTVVLPPTTVILPPTSCPIPGGWIRVMVGVNDTLYTLAERYKTTTDQLSAANCLTTLNPLVGSPIYVPPVPTVTVIPCGPPANWVKSHVVQTGDNLFRIALSYGTTYPQLQRANCMGSSTTIYAGQKLWVPNVPTRTPTVTATNPTASYTPTWTVVPPTATFTPSITPFPTTVAPTSTLVPSSTPPPTVTNTPPSPPP